MELEWAFVVKVFDAHLYSSTNLRTMYDVVSAKSFFCAPIIVIVMVTAYRRFRWAWSIMNDDDERSTKGRMGENFSHLEIWNGIASSNWFVHVLRNGSSQWKWKNMYVHNWRSARYRKNCPSPFIRRSDNTTYTLRDASIRILVCDIVLFDFDVKTCANDSWPHCICVYSILCCLEMKQRQRQRPR